MVDLPHPFPLLRWGPLSLGAGAAGKACGLSGLGLTDHDTLAGGEELFQAGRAFGLPVVLGVEISCSQRDGRQLHLLGYAIPPEGRQAVEDFCRPIRQARNRAVLQSAQALAQAGYPVSESGCWPRQAPRASCANNI